MKAALSEPTNTTEFAIPSGAATRFMMFKNAMEFLTP
jgi:hypothetical protein